VYRVVAAYKRGERWLAAAAAADGETPGRWPSLKRSLLSLLKHAPTAYGWCRVRWSCQTPALQLRAQRSVALSRETIRRWLHEVGYRWKRARHVARNDDPQRVAKLARIRAIIAGLKPSDALFFADELDIHLLAKLGYE
jgi:transposase